MWARCSSIVIDLYLLLLFYTIFRDRNALGIGTSAIWLYINVKILGHDEFFVMMNFLSFKDQYYLEKKKQFII